jgi:peptidoglycan/xylan/chitin deacetylase (PgdA/CDA1 family)
MFAASGRMLLRTPTLLAAHGAFVAGLGILARGTFVPSSRLWGPVISRGSAVAPARVALTFDDGPTPGATDRVLDILGGLRVPATFFAIGHNALRAPDLLVRAASEGHLIANHTQDHSHWGIFGGSAYWDAQVDEADRVIERIIGRKPAMFRPPIGIKTFYTMRAARRAGHAVVTWNRRAWDGMGSTDPQCILDRLLPRCRAGDIILLHDGVDPHVPRRDPSATIAALRPLILGLRARGLEPVRLDELTGLPGYAPAKPAPEAPA